MCYNNYMGSILVISNDPALAETLASELAEYTIVESCPEEAASYCHPEKPSLILADQVSPDEAGLSTLFGVAEVPMINLTRPLRLSDLLYTIRERLQGKTAPAREEMALSALYRFSPLERLVRTLDGSVRIALTEKEAELLACLLDQKGETAPRDVLLKRVWGYSDDIATHTLETHIYRLRGKLRQLDESLDIIFSNEGGYRLKVPAS